jgi:hypothetical protein
VRYVRHTYSDGSVHLFEQFEGNRREISPQQYDYLQWLREGNVPDEMITQAPKPQKPIEKTEEEKQRDLERKRKSAIDNIAVTKWNYIDRGFEHAGHMIDTNADSRSLLNAAATRCLIDPGFVFNWKTKGGAYLTLNRDLLMALCIKVSNFVEEAFIKEASLIKQIAECKTEEEIEKINWGEV